MIRGSEMQFQTGEKKKSLAINELVIFYICTGSDFTLAVLSSPAEFFCTLPPDVRVFD